MGPAPNGDGCRWAEEGPVERGSGDRRIAAWRPCLSGERVAFAVALVGRTLGVPPVIAPSDRLPPAHLCFIGQAAATYRSLDGRANRPIGSNSFPVRANRVNTRRIRALGRVGNASIRLLTIERPDKRVVPSNGGRQNQSVAGKLGEYSADRCLRKHVRTASCCGLPTTVESIGRWGCAAKYSDRCSRIWLLGDEARQGF